jgi:hypothetical protein
VIKHEQRQWEKLKENEGDAFGLAKQIICNNFYCIALGL